jgi:uncharacterized delta-60 repeat protein
LSRKSVRAHITGPSAGTDRATLLAEELAAGQGISPLLFSLLSNSDSRIMATYGRSANVAWAGRPAALGKGVSMYRSLEMLESRMLLSAGDVDAAFGVGGYIATDFPASYTAPGSATDAAIAAAVAPGGKVVVLGSSNGRMALAQYNADGTPDITFGRNFGLNGRMLKPCGANARFSDLAIGAGGRIVVVAELGGKYSLFRYLDSGTTDAAFGRGGKIATNLPVRLRLAAAVLVQAKGRVLLVASMPKATRIIRYNSNGSIDKTFATNGYIDIANAAVSDMVIDSAGRIVLGGASKGNFFLARLTARGALDRTFGLRGTRTTNFGQWSEIASLALQTDGKVLAAGSCAGMVVARYTAAGKVDTTFGMGGRTIISAGNPTESARDIVVQSDGEILVGGVTGVSQSSGSPVYHGEGFLARLTAAGQPDAAFGSAGQVQTDMSAAAGDGDIVSLVLQEPGKFLAVGTHDADFALGRFEL